MYRALVLLCIVAGVLAPISASAPPPATLVPGELNFGNQPIGTTAERFFTFRNLSSEPIFITGFGFGVIAGECNSPSDCVFDFGPFLCPEALAPNDTCQIGFTLTPRIRGFTYLAEFCISYHVGSVFNPIINVCANGRGRGR